MTNNKSLRARAISNHCPASSYKASEALKIRISTKVNTIKIRNRMYTD